MVLSKSKLVLFTTVLSFSIGLFKDKIINDLFFNAIVTNSPHWKSMTSFFNRPLLFYVTNSHSASKRFYSFYFFVHIDFAIWRYKLIFKIEKLKIHFSLIEIFTKSSFQQWKNSLAWRNVNAPSKNHDHIKKVPRHRFLGI